MHIIRLGKASIVFSVLLCFAQPISAEPITKMIESNSLLMKLLIALPLGPVNTYLPVQEVLTWNTFRLEDGRKVRLIGVDSNQIEMSADRAVEKDIERYLSNLVLGKDVRLKLDRENTRRLHRDRNGSILAYVYLKDGTLVNKELVRQSCRESAFATCERSTAFKP